MAIYTRNGAPVRITAAERRPRWAVKKKKGWAIYDKPPTAVQMRGALEVEKFDLWWIKAQQVGAYPDGSGADNIGKYLDAPEDKTHRGFLDENFFRADDGIREIHAECEMKSMDAIRAA